MIKQSQLEALIISSLVSNDPKKRDLARGFIREACYQSKGWDCDIINELDQHPEFREAMEQS